MMQSSFVAKCPYELGDLIILKKSSDIYEIYDIKAVHSLRKMTVEFLYTLRVNDKILEGIKENEIEMFMLKQIKNIEN